MPHPRPDTSVVKRCSGCKETLPRETFGPSKGTFDGLYAYCRACNAKRHDKWRRQNLGYVNAKQREWHRKNPDKGASYELKQNYGISLDTYNAMLAEQSVRCAICKRSEPGGRGRFHVDHCHDTGTIRGLLCHACNLGIGQLKHSAEILKEAIKYITRTP